MSSIVATTAQEPHRLRTRLIQPMMAVGFVKNNAVKTCFKCHVEQPLNRFYRHPRMADGHLNKCKACTKRDVKNHYYSTIEQQRDYERKRFQTPYRKAKVIEYQKKRRAVHPQKNIARQTVARAIANKTLLRQPCEVCGSTKVEAHHYDYSKPLDVRWLCRKHHLEEHGKIAWEAA